MFRKPLKMWLMLFCESNGGEHSFTLDCKSAFKCGDINHRDVARENTVAQDFCCYFAWSTECVLFPLDTSLELIHLLFFARWDSELRIKRLRAGESNVPGSFLKQQDLDHGGNTRAAFQAVYVYVFGRETEKQTEIKTVYEENRGMKTGGEQRETAGGKEENQGREGKGNIVCLAELSIHLSPPLYCLSRCLMVYYVKPKAFRLMRTLVSYFQRDSSCGLLCQKNTE